MNANWIQKIKQTIPSFSKNGRMSEREKQCQEIKYPIEFFSRLSANEREEMEKEWELTCDCITDSFFRFYPFCFSIDEFDDHSDDFYEVYIEVRYENGKPDKRVLLEVESVIDEKLINLEEEYSAKGGKLIDYKRILQLWMEKEFRQLLAQKMPELEITDVIVEPLYHDGTD